MIENIKSNNSPDSDSPKEKQESWEEEYMRLVRTGNDELILEFLFKEGLDKEWADKHIAEKENNNNIEKP